MIWGVDKESSGRARKRQKEVVGGYNNSVCGTLWRVMIVAYENRLMYLVAADRREAARVPAVGLETDDDHLHEAFDALTHGKDVWVWTYHGIRYLYHFLRTRFQFVKAAGGVVCTPEGDCLMIDRQGHWDLPKGMVEPVQGDSHRRHERLAEAARREVTEETGVTPDKVNSLITKTYHIYDKYGGWHLKQTAWFGMTARRQPTRPQSEEEIAQAVWVPRAECLERLAGSFASLRLLGEQLATQQTVTRP